MAENSSGKRMLITFTLPISCQICLGKVKQPTVCPNQHVFCSSCIELWLKHNQQCPTCRIPITPENPCKQIIGGHNQEHGGSDFAISDPALRRARFDILYQDCENEIKKLQEENETLRHSNSQLRQRRLANSEGALASSQLDETSANAKTQNGRHHSASSPRSSPSAIKLKSRNKSGADMLPQDQQDQLGVQSSNGGVGDSSGQMLTVLRSKLKQATAMYEKIKEDMNKLKEKNTKLSEDNRNLLLENGRLKQSATRSLHKYEKYRYTSMAQQAKLDECQREVTQLKSALDRSDNYIEELETKLDEYKVLYGSLPRKRRCHGDEIDAKTAEGVISAKAESAFALGRLNKTSEAGNVGRTDAPSTSESVNRHNPLGDKNDQLVNNLWKDKFVPRSVPDGTYSRDELLVKNSDIGSTKDHLLKDSEGSRMMLKEIPDYKVDVFDEDALRRPSKSDLQDDEQPRQVRTTPSTAMEKLSLHSDQKLKKPPSPSDTFSSSPGLETSRLNQSCHRQLDFGKDNPETSLLWSSLDTSETHGLMVEGNQVAISPLDQNATFSDLNFTLTSEIFDCAQFMKEAEERLKSKRQHGHDDDVDVKSKLPSIGDKDKADMSSEQKGTKRKSPGLNDKGNFQFFDSVHLYQIKDNDSHATYKGCGSSTGHQSSILQSACSKTQDNTHKYLFTKTPSWPNLKESGNRFAVEDVGSLGSLKTLKPESSVTASFQMDSTKEAFKTQELSQAKYDAFKLHARNHVAKKGVKLSTDHVQDHLGTQDREDRAKTKDGHSERPASSSTTHLPVRGTASSKSFFPLPRRVEVKDKVLGESRKKIRSDWGSDDDDD